jgi:hypothetical protein
MAEVVPNAPQDFWRSPADLGSEDSVLPSSVAGMAQACTECGTEFMIGANFCHSCGLRREASIDRAMSTGNLAAWRSAATTGLGTVLDSLAMFWTKTAVTEWLQYLHFHEIKRRVGLPTASLIAFIIGLGCVAGAVGVSVFYRASNLAEFQAIQMWRMEWLLAATASFVAGILLKHPSGRDSE